MSGKDHTYNLGKTIAVPLDEHSLTKKRKLEENKRQRDNQRQKTRVNIGAAFPKWKSLMKDKGFRTDAELACFLLDSYEKSIGLSPTQRTRFQEIDAAGCTTDRSFEKTIVKEEMEESDVSNSVLGNKIIVKEEMEESAINDPPNSANDWADEGSSYIHQKDEGSSDDSSDEETDESSKKAPSTDQFQFIGMDGTVHDMPAQEGPPIPPSLCFQAPIFPEPQLVLSEDDIIGSTAAIVYEDCLRQLASFMILPVNKCTTLLPSGISCDCVAPFEVNIICKGTAMIVDWVCPNGHSLWKWNSQPVLKYGMQVGDFLLSANILLSGSNYTQIALLFKLMNMGMLNRNTFFSIKDTYCVDTARDFCEDRMPDACSRLQGKDEARVLFTALNCNFSLNRAAGKAAQGKDAMLDEKTARKYSLNALKSDKTFGYITELQAMIVKRRISTGVGMPRTRAPRSEDPSRLSFLPLIPPAGGSDSDSDSEAAC